MDNDTKRGTVERGDVALAMAAAPARDTATIRTLGWLSEIADQPPLLTVCAATLALGLGRGDARLARAGLRMLASALVATALKGTIKRRVDRTRPFVVAEGGRYEAEPGDADTHRLNSFPSGHTAGAVAVAAAIAHDYPEHRRAARTAAAAIGAVQVPRATHYPTDVIAGAAVGLVAELVAGALLALVLPPGPRPA